MDQMGEEGTRRQRHSLTLHAQANRPPERAADATRQDTQTESTMGGIHATKGAAGRGGRSTATTGKGSREAAKPALLAGGNPQIAKADGDAPVQAYISALPGWGKV